jgi:hypothetical protein
MVQTHPKYGRQEMVQTIAGVDAIREEEEGKTKSLMDDGNRGHKMKWKKDSTRTQKKVDKEPEDVGSITKTI